MAVYTILSDEDIETIKTAYGLGDIINLKGIAEGVQNSNYLLETTDGRFILTIYEAMVSIPELPFYLGATEKAANLGLPAARPLKTKDNKMVFEFRGKSCAICTFLNGLSPKTPNTEQTKAAGAMLANLHNALNDYDNIRENDLSLSGWKKMWGECKLEAEKLENGLSILIEQDLKEFEDNWPKDGLPKGFIHADLFPDNVLFTGDKVTGIIDFYFGATDFFAYDLAVMLNAWCFISGGREFDITKGKALIAGYQSVRPFNDKEKMLMPLLARGAALRFFLTRMIDWTKDNEGAIVTKKNPREYTNRLAFHRNAKSFADYGG